MQNARDPSHTLPLPVCGTPWRFPDFPFDAILPFNRELANAIHT